MRLTSLHSERAGSAPRPSSRALRRHGWQPPRSGTARPQRTPATGKPGGRTGRLIALFGVAILCTVAGSWLLAGHFFATASPSASVATLHDVSAELHGSGWAAMDAHSMDQGGFQMPAQMMPGAPAGNEMRLGIPITLRNTGGGTQGFKLAEEFFLVGGLTEAPVVLHSDTFGLLSRLAPGTAVNGVLYFDTTVPSATDPPLALRWQRGGDTIDLAIPMLGSTPAQHNHGS